VTWEGGGGVGRPVPCMRTARTELEGPRDEAPLATAAAAAVRARAGQVPRSATPDLQVGRGRRGGGPTHGAGRAAPARALPASAGAVAHGGVE